MTPEHPEAMTPALTPKKADALPDLVLMGRALGAFGLKGEIRIFYHGADISLLPAAGTVWLGAEPLLVRPYQVVNVRHHKGRLLLSVAGVGDRDRAEEFRGCFLYVDKQALPPLAEDEIGRASCRERV